MIALFIYPLLLNFMQITSLMASFVDQNFEVDNFISTISIKARSLVRSRSKGTITIALEGKKMYRTIIRLHITSLCSMYNVSHSKKYLYNC